MKKIRRFVAIVMTALLVISSIPNSYVFGIANRVEAATLTGETNADKVYNYFRNRGYTNIAAAAIVGNIIGEAGGGLNFNLHAVESTKTNPGEGVGMIQWSFSRKTNFMRYCNSRGTPWYNSSLETQILFLEKELNGDYGKQWVFSPSYSSTLYRYNITLATFKRLNDLEKATGAFCCCFERPLERNVRSSFSVRFNWAQTVLQRNGGNTSGTTSTPSVPHNPVGYLEEVEGGNGTIRVKGWALDYDNLNAALNVHVYVGGPKGGTQYAATNGDVIANQSRPDVPKNLGSSVGEYHGFDYTFKVNATGTYPVYVYAINVGAKDTADCNSLLTLAPKIVTIKAAEQVCSTPDVSFSDIAGGKQLKITAASGETIHYAVNKDGAENSGTASGSYTTTFTEKGNYTVSAYSSKAGCKNSGKTTKQVTVSAVETPAITQSVTGDGVVLSMQSKTDGATIYYTTSGNTPTVSSNKFTGAVTVNSEKTIKAIAVKAGYVNSEISETKVKLSVPDSPQNFALTSESKIAVGDNATVKWDAMPSAASYTVTVYKDNK